MYVKRLKPFRVFILQIRADKLLASELRLIVGEIPRPIQDAIESGLRDGNDGGELEGWGEWREWDEFENDMRMKELVELLRANTGNREQSLLELFTLVSDGID